MSTDWNVHCLDCNDTYRFDEPNHMLDLMRSLVKHAPAIAALAPLMAECGDGVRMETYYGRIDPSWFAAHAGHHLVPKDQYGRCDDECGEYIACSACGARHRCRLLPKHTGDCSKERPAHDAFLQAPPPGVSEPTSPKGPGWKLL
jgi:hypothetical protein